MNQASSRVIFIIRHGEKPPDLPVKAPPFGVDLCGSSNDHSLTTVGWQRAGALATLFAPFEASLRPGLLTPTQLISPDYGDSRSTAEHRTYETIFPLGQRIKLPIENPYKEGCEVDLATTVSEAKTGVTLICWEHQAIPTIAKHISPVENESDIPSKWPGARFDVVWSFVYTNGCTYQFSQVPQMLLAGDSDSKIPVSQPEL
jgi:hypothetical protein